MRDSRRSLQDTCLLAKPILHRGPAPSKPRTGPLPPEIVAQAAFEGDLVALVELLQGTNPSELNGFSWLYPSDEAKDSHSSWDSVASFSAAVSGHPFPSHRAPPLHHAIANGQVDTVKFLLSKGANVSVRSEIGFTARELAVGCLMVASTQRESQKVAVFSKIINAFHGLDHQA